MDENTKYCDAFKHDYEEDYYGYKCKKCGQFIPYGCEPWLDFGEEMFPLEEDLPPGFGEADDE